MTLFSTQLIIPARLKITGKFNVLERGVRMKNKAGQTVLLLFGYCIPFAFLGIYGDVSYDTMWLYALLAAGMGLLCLTCIKFKNPIALVLGNIISGIVSVLCAHAFISAELEWYFKPLTARKTVILISLGAFLIQFMLWKAASKKAKQ